MMGIRPRGLNPKPNLTPPKRAYIIADNSWKTGWFARSADGSNVCERGAPLVAADDDIFYFVNDRNCKSLRQFIC